MSSNVADICNHHKQDDLLTEVNEQQTDKKCIEFNHLGLAVGPLATHFRARVGYLVMTYVPISFVDWNKVPDNFKDDVWNELVKELEVPSYLKKTLEKSMTGTFRKLKYRLRKSHLDKHPNLEAQKLDVPTGIKKEVWEQFCINEYDDKRIKFRAIAAESRKNSKYGHTGGRKSSAMIEYEMVANRGGAMVTRTEVWIEGHTRKNKSILPSAIPFMEKIKEKIAESKINEGNSNVVHPLSIDDDPLTQVFGKKSKGLPGVGSTISRSTYEAALHAHVMHSGERCKKESLEKKVDKMETQLDLVFGYCKSQMMGGSSSSISMPEVTPTSTLRSEVFL